MMEQSIQTNVKLWLVIQADVAHLAQGRIYTELDCLQPTPNCIGQETQIAPPYAASLIADSLRMTLTSHT